MTVRAKFVVREITRSKHWDPAKKEVQTIKLFPVTSGSDENAAFYAATPNGSIELACCNAEAATQFDIGREFYVDFTPSE